MWAAFVALNLSAFLQSLAGTGQRAHAKRLRREFVTIAGRISCHARRLVVCVAPKHHTGAFATGWRTLSALPSAAGP